MSTTKVRSIRPNLPWACYRPTVSVSLGMYFPEDGVHQRSIIRDKPIGHQSPLLSIRLPGLDESWHPSSGATFRSRGVTSMRLGQLVVATAFAERFRHPEKGHA